MSFLLVLACTVALVFLLKDPLKKYPMVFYAGAVALIVLYVGNLYVTYPEVVRSAIFLLMQKCTLSLSLFVIVMFVGVFWRNSKIALTLRPIRAELSILACILSMGHVSMYLMAFVPRFFGGIVGDAWLTAFFIAAVALLALLLVLGITSFSRVKRLMSTTSWAKLQKWSYVFFGLIYLHLVIILLPSALVQGATAMTSIAVYTVVFGLYAVLRVRRTLVDAKAKSDNSSQTVASP